MNEKTIATVALREGGFSNLQEILHEAARWVEVAASQGANLAVLPETINLLYRKDSSRPLAEFAIENWKQETAILCERAARCGIALVLPLLVQDGKVLANRFYVFSKDGTPLGFYQKRVPAPGEKAAGIKPANTHPIHWEGLKIGGAVCFDVYYPQFVFDPQVASGADLFVIPSLTPAGSVLDFCALTYGVPFVLAYSAWSRILDRDGTELAAGGYRSETLRFGFGSPVLQATINFDAVTLFADYNQEKMRDVQRHYGQKVRIRFNQPNCLFTLESRSADLSVDEVIQQFGLISRRDYFAQHKPK
jgi:hypothetical protein